MAIQDSETLKSYWSLGKVATPSNYVDLIDTIFEKSVVGNISTEHVNITSTSVQLKDGDTVYTELAGGSLTLGLITEDHILVGGSGIRLKDDTVIKIDLQADGDVFIGEDVSSASTTFMSIFSNSQIYNEELISAGNVLLGDNTSSKANILWDKSAGKLLFRGGTTSQAEIDTTGAIVAGGGNVIIDSTGLHLLSQEIVSFEHAGAAVGKIGLRGPGFATNAYIVEVEGFRTSVNFSGVELKAVTNAGGVVANVLVENSVGVGKVQFDVGGNTVLQAFSTYVTISQGAQLLATNSILVNDTANSKMTLGVTINQGTNDDEILSFKSADVSHGMTDVTEDDTFAFFKKNNGDTGALQITGLNESGAVAMVIRPIYVTGNTGKATTDTGALTLYGSKKSGTTTAAMDAGDNILAIRNSSTALFFFDADGDFTYHGKLQSYKNSTVYDVYGFVPLTTPYTNTGWDGDDTKTTGTYTIDLSADYNAALAGAKAVLVRISGEWATASDGNYAALRPRGSSVTTVRLISQGNARTIELMAVVPTDATNSDIDVVIAGASMTLSILEIWGYWI